MANLVHHGFALITQFWNENQGDVAYLALAVSFWGAIVEFWFSHQMRTVRYHREDLPTAGGRWGGYGLGWAPVLAAAFLVLLLYLDVGLWGAVAGVVIVDIVVAWHRKNGNQHSYWPYYPEGPDDYVVLPYFGVRIMLRQIVDRVIGNLLPSREEMKQRELLKEPAAYLAHRHAHSLIAAIERGAGAVVADECRNSLSLSDEGVAEAALHVRTVSGRAVPLDLVHALRMDAGDRPGPISHCQLTDPRVRRATNIVILAALAVIILSREYSLLANPWLTVAVGVLIAAGQWMSAILQVPTFSWTPGLAHSSKTGWLKGDDRTQDVFTLVVTPDE